MTPSVIVPSFHPPVGPLTPWEDSSICFGILYELSRLLHRATKQVTYLPILGGRLILSPAYLIIAAVLESDVNIPLPLTCPCHQCNGRFLSCFFFFFNNRIILSKCIGLENSLIIVSVHVGGGVKLHD